MKNKDMDQKQAVETLTVVLENVFGKGVKSKKFIDVSRIPLICKNIEGIHQTLGKLDNYIQDDANWKKEFDIWKTEVVSPLIKQESDKNIERKFTMKWLKYLGTVIGTLATLGLIFNYFINPLFKLFK